MRDQLLDDLRVVLAGEVEQLLGLAAAEQLGGVAADELGEVGRDHGDGSTTVQPAASARSRSDGSIHFAGRPKVGSVVISPCSGRGAGRSDRSRARGAPGRRPRRRATPEISTRYRPGRRRRSSRMWTGGTMTPSSSASCLRRTRRGEQLAAAVRVDDAEQVRPTSRPSSSTGSCGTRALRGAPSRVARRLAAGLAGRRRRGLAGRGRAILGLARCRGGEQAEREEQEVRHAGEQADHGQHERGDLQRALAVEQLTGQRGAELGIVAAGREQRGAGRHQQRGDRVTRPSPTVRIV